MISWATKRAVAGPDLLAQALERAHGHLVAERWVQDANRALC
jgi:hypothetical protein